MTIYILRGAHANEYELQNYYPLIPKLDLQVITTKNSLTPIKLPHIKLSSPVDLAQFPYKRQALNRLIGGEQWYLGLSRIIHREDIVHTAETYTPYTHQAVLLRKKDKIRKLICTCWETIPHNNEKFMHLRKWKKDAYRYVDIFHTPTNRAKDALVKEGVDPRKIKVIHYGVDQAIFKPASHRPHPRPVILCVSRLVPEKGMKYIDQAAKNLPLCDFWVIGQGSYQFSSPNIRTYSCLYRQMPRYYQQADIFFFPSVSTPTWEEQYGMALLEARSCGLPIVTTGSGAIPEVINYNLAELSTRRVAQQLANLYL